MLDVVSQNSIAQDEELLFGLPVPELSPGRLYFANMLDAIGKFESYKGIL